MPAKKTPDPVLLRKEWNEKLLRVHAEIRILKQETAIAHTKRNWNLFNKLTERKRTLQTEAVDLQDRLAWLNKSIRENRSFESFFLDVCREWFDEQTFEKLLQETKRRYDGIEPTGVVPIGNKKARDASRG